MALKAESLDALKSAILIAAIAVGIFTPHVIASRIWGDMLTRSGLAGVALPFVFVAAMVYFFYLRRPYPSRYGHQRGLLGSEWGGRTHFRDMIAMLVIGVGSGAFTSTVLLLF